MSRTIDEKVVEMRFDNADFERNVSQSMSTLDKLKSALDFSGAEKAFSGISSAADNVDFGGLTGALSGVGEKFSALETIAIGALMNIGASIETWVVDKLKAVSTDQIVAGFDKYGEKTTAVQTIMNATGRTIDDVSDKLATLNWFTDETSYNFTDMTNSIGKFTSQGIELEDAVSAMEGISTAAALAGQNAASASRVMYNFSQSLGMGAVKLPDWMSVENANMATEEFKQTIIDTAVELGRLDKYGNINEIASSNYNGDHFVNVGNFRSTLAAGWFDNKVLIAAMNKFGGFAGRLNEVYDQFNENYDVTTSQILTWLNAYMDGTLEIEDVVKKTGLAAEEILPILEELSSDEYELGRRAFAAAQEAKTFEDVINATTDAVSTAWMNVFENIFGNYEEAKVTWTQLSNELWDIFAGPISNLNDLLTDWHDMGGREDFIQSIKNMYHAVRSFLDPIGEAWEAMEAMEAEELFGITKRFREFTEGLILSEEKMDKIRGTFEGFFRDLSGVKDGLGEYLGGLSRVFSLAKDGIGGLTREFAAGFSGTNGLSGFFGGISDLYSRAGAVLSDFAIGIRRVRGAMDALADGSLLDTGVLESLREQYPLAAKLIGIYDKLAETMRVFGTAFGKYIDLSVFFKDGAISFDTVVDGMTSRLAAFLGAITEVVHIWTGADIAGTADGIRKILFDLADGLKTLAHHEGWGKIKDGILGIGTAFRETFGGIEEFFGPAWTAAVTIFNDWLEGIRMLLGSTGGDLDGFFGTIVGGLETVQDFIRNNEGFSAFINGIKDGIVFVSEFLTKFLSLTDSIRVYQENGGGLTGLLAVIEDKLKIILDTVFDIIQNVTGLDLHYIGDGVIDVIQGIGFALLQVADTVSKAFGWNDNPFGKLLESLGGEYGGFEGVGVDLSGIFDKIGGAFSKFGEIVQKMAPGVSDLLSGLGKILGDVVKLIRDLTNGIDLPTLTELILLAIKAFATIRLMHKAGDALEAVGNALTSWQKTLKVTMLLEIAGAIALLAGAAFLISRIDSEKIGGVIGTLATSFAGLIGVLLVSQFADSKSLHALPQIALALAASMILLAKAVGMMVDPMKALGELENFWPSFGRLAALLGLMSAVLGAFTAANLAGEGGGLIGAAKDIRQFVVSAALLLGVLKLYSMVDWPTIGDGLLKIAAAFGALGLVSAGIFGLFELMSRIGDISSSFSDFGGGMLKVVGALAILMGLLAALSLLGWSDILSSLGKIGVALLGLVAGILALSFAAAVLKPCLDTLNKLANVLFKIGAGVALFSGGLLIFGLLAKILGDAADDLIDAGMTLVLKVLDALAQNAEQIAEDVCIILLDILMVALRLLAEHIPEITEYVCEILGGLIKGVKQALGEGGIDLSELIGGGGLLAGLIAAVWLLKKSGLTTKDFLHAGLMILEAAALLVEIGALFAAIGWLSDKVGGVEMIRSFGEFCSAIAGVFEADWGVGVLFAAIAGLLVLFDKFNLGAISAGAFGSVVVAIAEVAGVIEAMGLIFAAGGAIINLLEQIPGGGEGAIVDRINKFGDMVVAIADVIGGVVGHLIGSLAGGIAGETIDAVMSGYGDGLAHIAEKAEGFFTLMDGLNEGTLEGCRIFAEMILTLTKASVLDGLTSWFTGGIDFSGFADGLEGLGTGLQAFANETKDLDQGVVEKAAACAEIVIAFSQEVPSSGGLWQLIAGEKNLKEFGIQLAGFGASLYTFAKETTDLPKDVIENAAACADVIIAFAKDIPSNGSTVLKWLIGEKNIGVFGNQLSWFGSGLAKFAEQTKDIKSDVVENAALCADTVIAFAKEIPNQSNSWFSVLLRGDTSMETFGTNLEAFAYSFLVYAKYMEQINFDAVTNTSDAVSAIIEIAGSVGEIAKIKDANLDKFGSNLEKFGKKFKAYYDKVVDIDTIKANNIANAISNTIDAFVGTDDQKLLSKVEAMGEKVLTGITDLFGKDDSKKQTQTAAGKLIEYIADKFADEDSVSKVGKKISKMVSDAILKNDVSESLKKAGADIIDMIGSGITAEVDKEETGLKAVVAGKIRGIAGIFTNQDSQDTLVQKGKDMIGYVRRGMFPEGGSQSWIDSIVSFINWVASEIKSHTDVMADAGAALSNSVMSGMNSVDMSGSAKTLGDNFVAGFTNSINDGTALVQQAATKLASTPVKTIKTELDIRSPSRVAYALGLFFDEGLANGVFSGIPGVGDKILELTEFIKDKANSYLSDSSFMEIIKGSGFDLASMFGDGIYTWIETGSMDDFGSDIPEQLLAGFKGYVEDGSVAEATSMVTDDISEAFDAFSYTSYESGLDGGTSYGTGYIEGVTTTLEGAVPVLESSSEIVADAVATPIEERMTEVLSYAEWLAKEYPEGVTTVTPVYDFDDLKLQAGELEGILTAFDMADDHGKRMMIREQGADFQNEALANLLTRYWNEEPIREENRQRSLNALTGYQAYLAEQKELTQAQTAVQQSAYTEIQQTATEISENEQAHYEQSNAALEEIKMNVLSIRQELDGVHADINRIAEMNVYIDSDALVGATAEKYDEAFGNMTTLVGRGI
ncbi:MAG: hypothetical protein E7576_07265 [Ruminococcaceae bacterium]|nr:hypothetical protein [Oscillospiraceae bacterium]